MTNNLPSKYDEHLKPKSLKLCLSFAFQKIDYTYIY